MDEATNWAFPEELQPDPAQVAFDLDAVLRSVVLLRAEIPDDAYTAQILGTERVGNGVVIADDGLILTIGYVITEAETIWITTNDGAVVAGHALAYDFATGFGLVQPLGRLGLPPLRRGSAAATRAGSNVIVIGSGGRAHAVNASIFAKREFAGYWEYLLDEALFTAPAHPQWGGAALVGGDGRLIGIGSLFVQEALDGEIVQGNMFVPVDLLEPILDDLLKFGRSARAVRPWLGMYTAEAEGGLVVGGLAKGAPAESAGVRVGDIVLEVGGERARGLADLLRKTWSVGAAGVEVPLTLARKAEVMQVRVRSADRHDFLRKPQLQ
ncbi:MAG: S1C family serine protease [Casimicrobiaceae bacterium]